jgi:hypothetical protein
VEDSCDDGNQPSGSIKVGKSLNSCTTDCFSGKAQPDDISHTRTLGCIKIEELLDYFSNYHNLKSTLFYELVGTFKQNYETCLYGLALWLRQKVAGWDPMRRIIFFKLPNPSGRTRPWGLTEISTRSRKIMFLGSRARSVRRTDNRNVICEPIVQTMLEESSTSHNLIGLHGL